MLQNYYNENGWNNKISIDNLKNIEMFLENIPHLSYTGHGGTCIAFVSDDHIYKNQIIKVCIKNNSMLKSSEIFINYCNFLCNNGVKILKPTNIIYEDAYIIVYTQPMCSIIYELHDLSMVKILEIIKNLLVKQIKIPDLFYKNFGIYENDIYIYDYHDYEYFFSDDKYYITHIAHLFSLYYNGQLFVDVNLNVEVLKELQFGSGHIPANVCKFLEYLYDLEFDKAIESLTSFISEIKEKVKCQYVNYQYIDVDVDGKITLTRHTYEKFMVVGKLLDIMSDEFTLKDYGCSIGGIGSLTAQLYPKSKVTLNNITKTELQICKNIVQNSLLINVTVENKNIIFDEESHDICLYFAILHHILKHMSFHDVIQLILKQINKYAVIELPFGGDVLLKNVMSDASIDYNSSFYYLETIDRFVEKISEFFTVIDMVKIDYNTDELNRYAFVLGKIV